MSKPSWVTMVWLAAPPRMRLATEPATEPSMSRWMLSRPRWGRASTKSELKSSVTLARVVLTSGAFCTTTTSSTVVWTSMRKVSSAGAVMPTWTSFCTTGLSLAAVARTSKFPGISARIRKEPLSSV